MNTTVGYVLVSQVHGTVAHSCGKAGCGKHPVDFCPFPERPRCHAACVPNPRLLAEHPECQEWQRKYDAWYDAHYSQRPNGGTRLGPLHYFRNCHTLLHRGPRRKDSRIVELESGVARLFQLPVCKECQAKMAPFEKQLADVVHRRFENLPILEKFT